MTDDLKDSVLSIFEASLDAQLRAVRRLRQGETAVAPRSRNGRSQVDMAYDVLKKARSPLHVSELLGRIQSSFGVTVDRESLVSSLTKKVARQDRWHSGARHRGYRAPRAPSRAQVAAPKFCTLVSGAYAVRIGMTNASTFAYVADGKNGLRVLQLMSPARTEGLWGFSPEPEPELIATFKTKGEAIALSKGLDRDRAVDKSGNQLAVFGRRGARPFCLDEMQKLYLRNGRLYTVTNTPPGRPQ